MIIILLKSWLFVWLELVVVKEIQYLETKFARDGKILRCTLRFSDREHRLSCTAVRLLKIKIMGFSLDSLILKAFKVKDG